MLEVQKWLGGLLPRFDNDLERTLGLLRSRYGIESKLYEDSVILNYNLNLVSYPDAEIVSECRALQLDRGDLSVVSRAFNRFLNYGEGDTERSFKFDDKTVVYDKIDGSLLILYWHGKRRSWEVRTRKSAYGENKIDGCKEVEDFRSLALLAMKKESLEDLNNSDLDKGKSYVFELVSPENKVITNWQTREVFYLSTFENESGAESEYEKGYAYIREYVNCRELGKYKLSRIEDVLDLAKKLKPVEEGYVVRNGKNERVKVKNPAYVALALLHNGGRITEKRILGLVEIGEDSEYLTYFPEEKGKFEAIKERKRKLLEECQVKYEEVKGIEEQKDFAMEVVKYKYSSILFKLRQGLSIEEIWREAKDSYKRKLLDIED